jgi:hypothetical protein
MSEESREVISGSFDDDSVPVTHFGSATEEEEYSDAPAATLAEEIGTGYKEPSRKGIAAPRRQWDFVSSINRSRPTTNAYRDQNPETGLPNLFDKDCEHCVNKAKHFHSYVSVDQPTEGTLPPNSGFNSDPIYTKASAAYHDFRDNLDQLVEDFDHDHAVYKEALKTHNEALAKGEESEAPERPKFPQLPEEAKAIRPKSERRKLRGALRMAKKADNLRAIYDGQEEQGEVDAQGNKIRTRIASPEELAAARARAQINITTGRNRQFIPKGKIKGK